MIKSGMTIQVHLQGTSSKRLLHPGVLVGQNNGSHTARLYDRDLTIKPGSEVTLFFDKDAVWKDTPPKPVEWWHQLGGGSRADSDRFAGGVLHERLHESMHTVTVAKCRAE